MALSEHEERILSQIEQRLEQDDPGLVARARKATVEAVRTRRLRLAAICVVLGFLALLGLTLHVAFGVVGFALMLFGLVLGGRELARGRGSLGERVRGGLGRGRDG